MTINTLTFIHTVLKEKEHSLNEAYIAARDKKHQAEDNEADNLDVLCGIYESAYEQWRNAHNAVTEFEAQEW